MVLSQAFRTFIIGTVKLGPALVLHALWVDEQRHCFYAYDGSLSFHGPGGAHPSPPSNLLWTFAPSGNAGIWSKSVPPSNFSTLVRLSTGLYASGLDLGFALGGCEAASTTSDLSQHPAGYIQLRPGLVMYNMSSQAWYNISSVGYSASGVALDGAAQFVPMFGMHGLLLIFGGTVDNGALAGTESVPVFDPISQQWSIQRTTGTKPQAAKNPCVVGVPGDDGTYEIFWYGGRVGEDIVSTVAQGSVFVLSLPSFNWQKQNGTPSTGRWAHSCNAIGNRQMAVIGGTVLNASSDINSQTGIQDPWEKGIGVFDLTAMEWKDGYDANAARYVTPHAVKDYYQRNGREPIWSNDVVKGWFMHTTDLDHANSTIKSAPQPEASSSGTDKGAIAGGTVGGVLGLALIVFLSLCLVRLRRRSADVTVALPSPEHHMPELNAVENMRLEMDTSNKPIEMAHRSVATSELPAHMEFIAGERLRSQDMPAR
ncbi:uncharacterized protein KY384_003574 [Bacidia gigantensis]|uniref:uncharacterized protein n=1 Tax=Bacidia gigantensis TaxID=2732470 RepID=UPI001D0492A0|nr:uncharacterized protein KY384_003574 [Bacidia gigantensis]KAG8531938.1 hypothetical protein KY384_003574 [Bacidia gigantensis]